MQVTIRRQSRARKRTAGPCQRGERTFSGSGKEALACHKPSARMYARFAGPRSTMCEATTGTGLSASQPPVSLTRENNHLGAAAIVGESSSGGSSSHSDFES